MDEDERLVLAGLFEHFLVADFVHDLVLFDGPFLRNTNKLLLERSRTVRCIEVEKSLGLVHAEESGDILVVW